MLHIASMRSSSIIMRKQWLPYSPNDAIMSMVSPVTRNVAGCNSLSTRVYRASTRRLSNDWRVCLSPTLKVIAA